MTPPLPTHAQVPGKRRFINKRPLRPVRNTWIDYLYSVSHPPSSMPSKQSRGKVITAGAGRSIALDRVFDASRTHTHTHTHCRDAVVLFSARLCGCEAFVWTERGAVTHARTFLCVRRSVRSHIVHTRRGETARQGETERERERKRSR